MSLTSVAELMQALRQHHLLPASEWDEVSRLAAGFTEPRQLARELVQRGWLTPYQVNQVFQGRAHELLLGSYVLLEKLGEGGMGAVYKARNWKLGQVVALKLIRPERLGSADTVKRFQREIRAAAQLNHPHIVQALDADEVHGTHFLVMEYVEGMPLNRLVKERGPLPVTQACDYVRQAALGLQHAFERGLIHRDIKPGNLLLASAGAVVKLLDLGLARLADDVRSEESSTLTQEGAVMGTPDFMAPEQTLDSHLVDIRSDLYSLGCTLYFLLTGRVPFPGGSLGEKLMKHQLREPEAVEKRRPDVPAAVAAVVRKLMAKDPAQRFQTPAELAAALGSILKEQPASRPTVSQQRTVASDAKGPFAGLDWSGTTPAAPKPEQRPPRARSSPPLLIAGVVTVGLLLVGGLGLHLFGAGKPTSVAATTATQTTSRQPTPQELEAQGRAEREKEAAAALPALEQKAKEPMADFASLAREMATFKAKYGGTQKAVQAAELLMKFPSPLDQLDPAKIPEDAKAAWKASGFDGKDVVGVLGEHRQRHWGAVLEIAWSPVQKLIASIGSEGTICLWESDSLNPAGMLRSKVGGFSGVAFSPNGELLLGGRDGALELWQVDNRQRIGEILTGEDKICKMAFVDDRQVVTGGRYGLVSLVDIPGRKLIRSLGKHALHVTSVAVMPNRKEALSAALDGEVHLIDIDMGTVTVLKGHKGSIGGMVIDAPGSRMVTAGEGNRLLSWDLSTRKPIRHFDPADPQPCSIAFRPSSSEVCTGDGNGTITRWDLDSHKAITTWKAHPTLVFAVAYSPDGKRIVSGAAEGAIRLWDVDTGKEVQPLTGPVTPTKTVAFAPDLSGLLTTQASFSGRVWGWDMAAAPREFAFGDCPRQVVWFPDGKRAVIADILCYVLDCSAAAFGGESVKFNERTNPALAADVSPEGRLVAAGYQSGNVEVWDVTAAPPKRVHAIPAHTSYVATVAFSPDGQRLATGGNDHLARVWDLTANPPKRVAQLGEGIAAGDGNVYRVAWAPDGMILVVARGADVQFWSVAGKRTKLERSVRCGSAPLTALAVHPAGAWVAAADNVGGVVVWNAADGTKYRVWDFPGPVNDLSFAADGRHLATANANGTVYILRLAEPPPKPLSAETRLAPLCLSRSDQ